MVKSNISDKVNYNESKEVEDVDVDYSAPIYEYKFQGIPIDIVLGKQNHSFSRHNIVYFPVYLIYNEELVSKIGYFETTTDKMIQIIDEEGDVQINKKGMIFFVDKDFIKKAIKAEEETTDEKPTEETKEEEKEEESSKEEKTKDEMEDDVAFLVIPPEKKSKVVEKADETLSDGIFEENKSATILPLLPEETKEQSDEIKKQFQESPNNNWVENFRKNNNYKIIDNEGGGDCFFAVIRDAFKQIGKDTTTEKLRALLAKEVTQDQFEHYRTLYNSIFAELKEKEQDMKITKKTIDQLKKRLETKTTNKDEEQLILKDVKQLLLKYNKLKEEKKQTNELLKEFAYMENLTDVEKFREFVQTSLFWADAFGIATIERLLNIKCIILSKEAYDAGDVDGVLQCGESSEEIEKRGVYNPDFYIMLSFENGNHYKTIAYKSKKIFKFIELPFEIRQMVCVKCLERNSGAFYLIKDFRLYKSKLGIDEGEGAPEKEEEYLHKELYDPKTTLMFYGQSNNAPKAGKGNGETTDDLLKFKNLNGIKDWRRKLDDTYIIPITINGHRYNSVAHYYMSMQFAKGFPDYALLYSLDSNSAISKTVKDAKEEYEHVIKKKKSDLFPGQITPDPDFFTEKEKPTYEAVREKGLDAKFTQNLDFRQLLLETKDAKLMHFERGKPYYVDKPLMELRSKLSL